MENLLSVVRKLAACFGYDLEYKLTHTGGGDIMDKYKIFPELFEAIRRLS